MRLRWTRAAERDLDRIEEYVASDSPDVAYQIVIEIIERVGILAEHPGIGRPGRVDGTREFVISGSPYIVAYVHQGDVVTVLRVLHGAMKWPRHF